jgi:hypothetical protein
MSVEKGRRVAMISAVAGFFVAITAGGIVLNDWASRKAILDRIEALAAAVPVELVSVTRSTEEITQDAAKCETLCRDFLARWPSRSDSWKVKGVLLRMLRVREESYLLELRRGGSGADGILEKREICRKEAIDLARCVVRHRDVGPAERHRALEILLEKDPDCLGGLEGIAELLEALVVEYSRRIDPLPGGPPRKQLEARLQSSEYLLARIYLGLGKYSDAKRIRRAAVTRGGRSPSDDFPLRFLENLAGRSPGGDLAEAEWLTETRVNLREARGSMVILLTHGMARPVPSAEGMPELQRFVEAHRADGLIGAILCFSSATKGTESASLPARDLREDLVRFGVSLPAAVLPTSRTESYFPRRCGGTYVIIDRQGKIVWESGGFGVEGQEWNLTRMVLERCLTEGRPEVTLKTS